MTIEVLQKEMISALKSGNKFRKDTISTLIAQIKRVAIDKGCRNNISEEMVDAELLKAKKTQQDSIDTCPVSRADLLEEYKKQMTIIMEFVPSLIEDENEIRNIILDCGFEVSKQNQSVIMKTIKTAYAGKVDMKKVSQVYKELVDGTSSH